MATPPLKSQHPLHNFSLPHLRWAHKTPSPSPSSRFRRLPGPGPCPDHPNPNQQSPPGNTASLHPAQHDHQNGDPKPWKELIKCNNDTADHYNDAKTNTLMSQRLRGGFAQGGRQIGGLQRRPKRKLWISLSREEIEEDVYALTGGKPARRPRKWPRNVQKQLDTVFPGLYLVGVAADSYRVMSFWWFAAMVPWWRYTSEQWEKRIGYCRKKD